MFYPGKRVAPYDLWIGSKGDSANIVAARQRGIGLIVNCTRDIPHRVPGVRRLRVPVDDAEDEGATFLAHLPRVISAIDHHLSTGHGVLVHCYAGVSRSASVVAAYLMAREGLTPAQAMARIRRLKPETFQPSPTFLPSLRAYAETLRTRQSTAAAPMSALRAAR